MNRPPFLEVSHESKGCYQDRIKELAEHCDHEYYMSVTPFTNKERAMRGQSRILEVLLDFKRLLEITECASCRAEITNQILLQEEGLREIEITWNV